MWDYLSWSWFSTQWSPVALSSIVIPENKDLEDVESRISELEDEMQLFKNLMVKGSNNETVNKGLAIAEESL